MTETVCEMTMQTRMTHMQRIERFLAAWHHAPPDADIEVRIGRTSTGVPCIFISIAEDMHPFTVDEADIVARSVESTIDKFGSAAMGEGLGNLLLALRQGAEAARRALPTEGAEP